MVMGGMVVVVVGEGVREGGCGRGCWCRDAWDGAGRADGRQVRRRPVRRLAMEIHPRRWGCVSPDGGKVQLSAARFWCSWCWCWCCCEYRCSTRLVSALARE